ncbi:MAG: PAS domain-containing protein, partial [Myxococcales bacterium]|nr:PAS domain-containing protein [Myxococcales bacterium]
MLETIVDAPTTFDDGFDVFALDSYDDARLDDLRFGVICLDDRGTVLRYNLAEARLARLDRSKVIGRDFFRRIAPCTATQDFEGRFRSFIAGREPRISFPYVFDFKFGAQEVSIELVRPLSPGRYYLCINRLAYREPRPAYESVAAPRQAELVPDERAFGVQRDDNEQRVVVLPASALRALRLTWDRVAPQGWSLFASEWGLRWGRLAVMDLETELLEQRDLGLRDLPLDEALGVICARVEQDGWGQLSIDCTSPASTSRGAAMITIERSAIGEAAGASALPRCQLIAGLLRALLGHLSQRVLAVR